MEYALEDFEYFRWYGTPQEVLILVLMEYALEVRKKIEKIKVITAVLILVLMEYALEAALHKGVMKMRGLNPCFNGICSRSHLNN